VDGSLPVAVAGFKLEMQTIFSATFQLAEIAYFAVCFRPERREFDARAFQPSHQGRKGQANLPFQDRQPSSLQFRV
jgi:hypothetical protein